MATYEKRGSSYRFQTMVNGVRHSKTFATKAEGNLWAANIEAAPNRRKLERHTLAEALKKYETEVAPTMTGDRGPEWYANHCKRLAKYPLAKMQLQDIQRAPDLTGWREARLKTKVRTKEGEPARTVSNATVNRQMKILRAVFEKAIEWGWLHVNPARGLKRLTEEAARKRRISEKEISEVVRYGLGYKGGRPTTVQHRVALAWLFCLETGMRGGEVLKLQRHNIKARHVEIRATASQRKARASKNGDERDVPLSPRAIEILKLLPVDVGTVFDLLPHQKDALFRKAVRKCRIENLHFHDSRAEAIFRLSKIFNVLELAEIVGHRDLKSLMSYYKTTADELSARFG